ncbi:unnamed protein product [Rodentolepis nana]|uniref:MFS domain-containing protein n=1 Tax=Rodentolepis nana TaxID=102285 RepID=A0A0R3T5Z7_RODNA|nr:unnamed protein product [Rodentolepis nana]
MCTLFSGSCLLYASRNILPICSSYIAKEHNWTRQDEGLVMGIFFWGYMLTQFAGGYFSDLYGGEIVLPLTTVIWGLITTLFVIIPLIVSHKDVIFHLFLLTRFLLGIFQGFFYPGLASLMAKHVQMSERQFTYSFITSGSHAGTLMCGFVGSFLSEAYSWGLLFLFIGSLAVFWAAFVFQHLIVYLNCQQSDSRSTLGNLNRPSFLHSSVKSGSVDTPTYPEALNGDLVKIYNSSPKISNQSLDWCLLLKQPAFWSMLLGNFVFNNTFYIILNWLPSYFHDNYPDAKSWIFNVVPWLIVAPCTLVSGFLADWMVTLGFSVTFVRKTISSVALLGTSVFLLILQLLERFYASVLCMALVLACCGFHNSGILLNPQDMAPMKGGQVFGVMSTVGTIPGFTGVYLTGYILSKWHNWSTVFHCAVFGNLVGWMFYVIFGSSKSIV